MAAISGPVPPAIALAGLALLLASATLPVTAAATEPDPVYATMEAPSASVHRYNETSPLIA